MKVIIFHNIARECASCGEPLMDVGGPGAPDQYRWAHATSGAGHAPRVTLANFRGYKPGHPIVRVFEVDLPASDAQAAGNDAHLRTADTDREEVVNLLKDAFVQGQITQPELDTRIGRALTARTYTDLAGLTGDLRTAATVLGATAADLTAADIMDPVMTAEMMFEIGNVPPEDLTGGRLALAAAYRARHLRSVSVGDVVAVGEVALTCASSGWKLLDGDVNEVHQGAPGSVPLRPSGEDPAPAP